MNKFEKKILFTLVCGALIFIGIYLSLSDISAGIYLYNPHDRILEVEIGANKYKVEPSEQLKISISKGRHVVKSSLDRKAIVDTTILIDSKFKKRGGILNLSGESFYLHTITYSSVTHSELVNLIDSVNYASNAKEEKLMVDSILVWGLDIKELNKNELLLEHNWYFGIKDTIDNEISTSSNIPLKTNVNKLFDKKGLLSYFENFKKGLNQ